MTMDELSLLLAEANPSTPRLVILSSLAPQAFFPFYRVFPSASTIPLIKKKF